MAIADWPEKSAFAQSQTFAERPAFSRGAAAAQENKSTKQATGFALVILLHVGLIYVLASGLGAHAIKLIQKPLQTILIDDPVAPPPELAPPPPVLAPPPPAYIPPPELVIRQSAAPTNAIAAVSHEKPVPAPVPVVAAPVHEPVRVQPVIEAAKRCQALDYPPMAKRLGEEGAVVLQFLIGEDGKVIESKVASSSGHPRLDEAARSGLGSCQFKPGTVDGKPEKSWAAVKYNWKLL